MKFFFIRFLVNSKRTFLLARTAAYLASDESEEFRKLLEKKRQYEEEFKKDGGERFVDYLNLAEDIALTSEFLYFQQGFFEGAKFILIMGSFCILPDSFINYLDAHKVK